MTTDTPMPGTEPNGTHEPADLLDSVRVVDLTDGYGAFASRLLADLGADVVRIEPVAGGDAQTRSPRSASGRSLHHLHRNVGKSIVTVDPATPEAASIVDGLLAGADIAFCSPGGVPGYEATSAPMVAARHPHLVVTAVSPFGIDGPTTDRQATELVAQALAGVVYRSGVPELAPVAAPGSYCEDVGAAVAALASLLALWQVRDGGHGQLLDVSTILALAQCTEMALPLASVLKNDQVRNGAGLYPLYECTDGLARLVLPMAGGEWRSLITWLGSPPEMAGPEWSHHPLAGERRDAILALLPDRFAAATRAEVAAEGDALGVRITPVLTPAEVLANEHARARGTFGDVSVDGAAGTFGDVSVDGAAGKVTSGVFVVNGHRPRPVVEPVPTTPPDWSRRPHPDTGRPSIAPPLAGVRVLELGNGIAAPEGGRVLSEWGADVIKLESSKRPDFQRRVFGSDMNPAFASPARNKRSFAADLGTDEGRQLVLDLITHVDVIIENNAVGVIDRLGLGWDAVSAINPRLVMVGTQLYGDLGPWADKKGYGPSARAIGGLTWLWAHGPESPRGVMTIYPDHLAGRLVAMSAVAGLISRERSGHGCRVNLAQFEVVATLVGDLLLAESLTPGAAQPIGNRSPDHAPSGLYRCADDDTGAERWLALGITDDRAWSALVAVGPAALAQGEWASTDQRRAAHDEIDAVLARWFRSEDAGVMEDRLQAVGVAVGQTLFPRVLPDHPLYSGRGFVVPVDQPGLGPLLLEGPAYTGSRFGSPRCDPAPLTSQHTAEICRDILGLDDTEIARLVASRTIEPSPRSMTNDH